MLRFFFLLLILAGAALGIGYPWAASNVTGHEIGTWRVYERERGFAPAEVYLAVLDAPVAATVDLRTEGALDRREGEALLTMEITGDGEPVQSLALDFAGAQVRTINQQSGETGYRAVVEKLIAIRHDRYRFTFGPGEAGTERLVSADLILNAGAVDLDRRAIPAGFIMMAVGLVGFSATLFRRRRRKNPNSEPPPRWGRGK